MSDVPTISDPRLRKALERLMGRATAVTMADLMQPDAPLVYVNHAFETMTGYPSEEVLGRNCRFLQGPDTDRDTVDRIRMSVETGTESAYCLLNYRRDGTPFHNLLMLAPLQGPKGGTYMIGCQYPLRPGVMRQSIDDHVSNVQGVVGSLGGLHLPNVIWSSLQTRSEAIRLVVDAYVLSVMTEE